MISKGESAEQVYQELTKKHDEIEKEWKKFGLKHLLKDEDKNINFIKLEKKV